MRKDIVKKVKMIIIGAICGAILTACSTGNVKLNEETIGTGPSPLEKEAVEMVVDGATQGLSE